MNTNVINDEYFENPVLSTDTEKNTIMMATLIQEYELWQEYYDLLSEYSHLIANPNYDGYTVLVKGSIYSIVKGSILLDQAAEVKQKIGTLLDGTGITKEEYEEAKKNLY